jgi:hypothetical protein
VSYLNTNCASCGFPITVYRQYQPCPHCQFPHGMNYVLRQGLLGLRQEMAQRSLKARLLSGD